MFFKIFRWGLVTRFISSVRQEGMRAAVEKARIYLGMVQRGEGRSVFPTSEAPEAPVENTDHLYLTQIWQTLARSEAFNIDQPPALLRKTRKIALIGDLNLPQCRKYRVEQLAEFWRQRDIDVMYSHYQDVPRCVNALQDATHLMEYRLQTNPLTAMYRYEARRLRLPVLYDLDDPLFSVSAYETYENMKAVDPALKAHFVSEAPKYLEMMNGADVISVSTPGMVEHAGLYSARPIYLRRNFADTSTLEDGLRAMRSARNEGRKKDVFRVAFASGSHGHEVDFAIIQDQIITFLSAHKSHRLMILGHFDVSLLPDDLEDQLELHPFTTYDAYLRHLATADCAVMPLVDDVFNRCKSGVRVIDASSVGVPSLVGTVGDMSQIVVHGKTGYVAQTSADWLTALQSLSKDRGACAAMGRKARETLESQWAGNEGAHIIDPNLLAWVQS